MLKQKFKKGTKVKIHSETGKDESEPEGEHQFEGEVLGFFENFVIVLPTYTSVDSEVKRIKLDPHNDVLTLIHDTENLERQTSYSVDRYSAEEETKDNENERILEGDTVKDENSPSWSETDVVKIDKVTSETAEEYYIEATDSTVAEENPEYPKDDTVVEGYYVEKPDVSEKEAEKESGKYAFPISRMQTL